MKTLLPIFEQYLHNGKLTQWIDNIFGIWVCNKCKCWKQCKHWKEFVSNLPFGRLIWTTEDPAKKTVFLDLTISIEKGKITTATYQKPMNLYLYLTAQSNHSPGLIKTITH